MTQEQKEWPPGTFLILGGHPLIKPSKRKIKHVNISTTIVAAILIFAKLLFPQFAVMDMITMMLCAYLGGLLSAIGVSPEKGFSHLLVFFLCANACMILVYILSLITGTSP